MMFNLDVFTNISLSHEQAAKIIEYAANNLCTKLEEQWYHDWGYCVLNNEFLNGTALLHDTLNKIWWNLCSLENYIGDKRGDGTLTNTELDKYKKRFRMPDNIIKELKAFAEIT